MVIRSVIFYSSEVTKNIAINIAKGLKGYVDVENYSLSNPHIEMDPFHNVIFIVENKNEDLLNCIKKYEIYLPFKSIFIVLLAEKSIEIDLIEYDLIKSNDIKELVVHSIKKINETQLS